MVLARASPECWRLPGSMPRIGSTGRNRGARGTRGEDETNAPRIAISPEGSTGQPARRAGGGEGLMAKRKAKPVTLDAIADDPDLLRTIGTEEIARLRRRFRDLFDIMVMSAVDTF